MTQAVWRQHWDFQLAKALEVQYRHGLATLTRSLPEVCVRVGCVWVGVCCTSVTVFGASSSALAVCFFLDLYQTFYIGSPCSCSHPLATTAATI